MMFGDHVINRKQAEIAFRSTPECAAILNTNSPKQTRQCIAAALKRSQFLKEAAQIANTPHHNRHRPIGEGRAGPPSNQKEYPNPIGGGRTIHSPQPQQVQHDVQNETQDAVQPPQTKPPLPRNPSATQQVPDNSQNGNQDTDQPPDTRPPLPRRLPVPQLPPAPQHHNTDVQSLVPECTLASTRAVDEESAKLPNCAVNHIDHNDNSFTDSIFTLPQPIYPPAQPPNVPPPAKTAPTTTNETTNDRSPPLRVSTQMTRTSHYMLSLITRISQPADSTITTTQPPLWDIQQLPNDLPAP
eukprot:5427576-Amphidinium_carterae.1